MQTTARDSRIRPLTCRWQPGEIEAGVSKIWTNLGGASSWKSCPRHSYRPLCSSANNDEPIAHGGGKVWRYACALSKTAWDRVSGTTHT